MTQRLHVENDRGSHSFTVPGAAADAETWPLAGWDGAQLRAKSGGTAGTVIVSATSG